MSDRPDYPDYRELTQEEIDGIWNSISSIRICHSCQTRVNERAMKTCFSCHNDLCPVCVSTHANLLVGGIPMFASELVHICVCRRCMNNICRYREHLIQQRNDNGETLDNNILRVRFSIALFTNIHECLQQELEILLRELDGSNN